MPSCLTSRYWWLSATWRSQKRTRLKNSHSRLGPTTDLYSPLRSQMPQHSPSYSRLEETAWWWVMGDRDAWAAQA